MGNRIKKKTVLLGFLSFFLVVRAKRIYLDESIPAGMSYGREKESFLLVHKKDSPSFLFYYIYFLRILCRNKPKPTLAIRTSIHATTGSKSSSRSCCWKIPSMERLKVEDTWHFVPFFSAASIFWNVKNNSTVPL